MFSAPRPRTLLFLVLFATAVCPIARASELARSQFQIGAELGPPMLLLEPVRSAADAQNGPRAGESFAAYGERVRRAGLAIGLTPAQANAARDFYQRRHAARWSAAARRPPVARPNLSASKGRVDRVLREPGWGMRLPERDAPTRPLLPSEASARLDPAIAAEMLKARPRRKTQPVPQSEEKRPGGDLPSFWQWARGGSDGRDGHRDFYYGLAGRYNERADSITRDSTGDSVTGWLSRKSYRFAAGASSLFGWMNDDEAPGRMWTQATGAAASLVTGMRRRPMESAAVLFLIGSNPMRVATDIAQADGKRRAERVQGSIKRAWNEGSTWAALDATYDTTTEVAEVASYASGIPALMRRVALRESLDAAATVAAAGLPRVKPRAWLTEAGANDALATVLESNYRRLAELNRQLVSRRAANAPAAELDAIRGEHWRLYDDNARMQREIPALKEYFAANPEAGTPGSRVFMEAVAANMGVDLVTLPRGVRLAGPNSLRRDLAAGGILPNPGKAAPEGVMTGSGAHLLRDGSPHMVSVAERLNGGIILLMTGYADAARVEKTTMGILYEFENVVDAAPLPDARQVFHGPLNQREFMVPQVPMDRIRHVRLWHAGLNPSDAREIFFDTTDAVSLAPGADAEAILAALREAPRPHRMRVTIPNKAELTASTYRPKP